MALLAASLSGCAGSPQPDNPAPRAAPAAAAAAGASSLLPPIVPVTGAIRLRVVYPSLSDVIDVRDSTFVFGTTGTGDAQLWVNGVQVPVAPNGAWLAWIAVPPDTVLNVSLVARSATDSATQLYTVRRVRRFQPPAAPVWIDSLSFAPASRAWWPANEPLPVSVRAVAGATVHIRLSDGTLVPLASDGGERYVGSLRGRALGADPGPFLGPLSPLTAGPPSPAAAPTLTVEAIIGADTARASWPLRLALLDTLPRVLEFNDDLAGTGKGDSLTVGRARPGATYHWFFPTGTRTVASGRLGDDLRVRLSQEQDAWVPVADAVPFAVGYPATRATVGSVTLTPGDQFLTLRIPMSQRAPFRVEEGRNALTLRLYNTVADINWTRFGATHPYLRDIRWLQSASDEVTLTLEFTATVWGYRTRWSGSDLLLEFRPPPSIDADHPLQGRLIVVDPGHPPLGATGPTGLTEATANLAIALRLRALLESAGARVIMTRTTAAPLDLLPRTRLADSVSADILVSIHNNALPDGVNPFTSNGASVFYNHPRSLPLARAVQRELVRQLGVRDLGAGRGDLALVRPTWMPSILTEGLFMMIPEQEAALASPVGQERYAVAVRDGLTVWLRSVARGGPDVP